MVEIKNVVVKENNHEMQVFIPQTGDKSYDDYIEEAEIEKTRDELRKKPHLKSNKSKEDIKKALKELSDYRRRKRENVNRKYF